MLIGYFITMCIVILILQYAYNFLFFGRFGTRRSLIWSFIPFGFIINGFFEIKKQFNDFTKEN